MDPSSSRLIRGMRADDWPYVRAIYADGIRTGRATFEQNPPSWETWTAAHLTVCRLVACCNETVVAWAALSPISSRCVYRGVAEVSIYVGQNHRGMGIGQQLLHELVRCSEGQGFWTLQAGVFPENEASLRLLARCGFRVVGCRKRIGQLHGVWRDVLLLERRSTTVGVQDAGPGQEEPL